MRKKQAKNLPEVKNQKLKNVQSKSDDLDKVNKKAGGILARYLLWDGIATWDFNMVCAWISSTLVMAVIILRMTIS